MSLKKQGIKNQQINLIEEIEQIESESVSQNQEKQPIKDKISFKNKEQIETNKQKKYSPRKFQEYKEDIKHIENQTKTRGKYKKYQQDKQNKKQTGSTMSIGTL